jgi:hypothetical protein
MREQSGCAGCSRGMACGGRGESKNLLVSRFAWCSLMNPKIKASDSQGFDTARLAGIEPVAQGLDARLGPFQLVILNPGNPVISGLNAICRPNLYL